MHSTRAYQGALLFLAGQQWVLRVGFVQVQQGSQALAYDNVPVNQDRQLAARVQCQVLRLLVLLCSMTGAVRGSIQALGKLCATLNTFLRLLFTAV